MTNDIEKILTDIKSIKIQGATNVAKYSIGALADSAKNFKGGSPAAFLRELERISKRFSGIRLDEPLNQNLIAYLVAKAKKEKSVDVEARIANFQKFCREALELISKNEESITGNGVAIIRKIQKRKKQQVNIFTHCHSSSVERILIEAHKSKIPFKVYNSETRPRYQGKITAKSLAKAGINVTMMVDDAAAFIFSKNDPDNIDIDLVIIGADVISKEGAVLNKIGSYSLALAAKEAKIPFYIAASLLKLRHDFASYHNIKIEKRDPVELWPAAAKAMADKQNSFKKLKVMNYAFDIVPPEYISGFITEFGTVKPKDVRKMAMKNYKEFFE